MRIGATYICGNIALGQFKIGLSRNPVGRFANLQAGVPFIVDYTNVWSTEYPERLEKFLHEELRDKRLRGEWFALAPEDFKRLYAAVARFWKANPPRATFQEYEAALDRHAPYIAAAC
jgi:Meiotically up-regulated gene 113